jgi:two-component sensor histidine kinase
MELETNKPLSFPLGRADGSTLLIAEFLHRSRNEYARGISLASLIAARSSSQETKAALGEMVGHLRRAVETQRLLCPPIWGGVSDFAESVTELCRAMSASFDMEGRGITFVIAVDEPLWLDSKRCWRAGLVIFELVSNAFRHAFRGRSGRILIAIARETNRVVCRVSDDGVSASCFKPGLGTDLVDALVAELDGLVERRHSDHGTVVTISFPREA